MFPLFNLWSLFDYFENSDVGAMILGTGKHYLWEPLSFHAQ